MLAAGILGETYDSLKRVESEGAGALVTKSIGPEPNPGYPGPITVEVEGGSVTVDPDGAGGSFIVKKEEECLAACSAGPMMTVDGHYHEKLTPEKVDAILDALE